MAQYKWQVQTADGEWEDYSDLQTKELESGNLLEFEIVVNGSANSYIANPNTKQQTNKDSGTIREIRRMMFYSTWDCNVCTYKNTFDVDKCQLCSTACSVVKPGVKRSANAWFEKATLPPAGKEREFARIYLKVSEHLYAGAPIADRTVSNAVWSVYRHMLNQKPSNSSAAIPRCQCIVFGCDVVFDDDGVHNFEPSVSLGLVCGGEAQICHSCMRAYLKAEIEDDHITPFIKSPVPGCLSTYLPPDVILLAPQALLLQFLHSLTSKMLSRCTNWVSCNDCHFGTFGTFDEDLWPLDACLACSSLNLTGKKADLDPSLQKMIDDGEAILCPGCKSLLVHSPAMCTLLTCQCGLVVNLVTGESGTSYVDLKTSARNADTLWHNDNLLKQQQMQANDPAGFKQLLKQHGVQFDANYQRGSDI